MSSTEKVEITGGFYFGFWAALGVLCAVGWIYLIFTSIDWIHDKAMPSAHKAHYIIAVQSRQNEGSNEMRLTEDYDRKLNGQIVFIDCDTGNQVTLSPGNYKTEIGTITDLSTARTCKTKP